MKINRNCNSNVGIVINNHDVIDKIWEELA